MFGLLPGCTAGWLHRTTSSRKKGFGRCICSRRASRLLRLLRLLLIYRHDAVVVGNDLDDPCGEAGRSAAFLAKNLLRELVTHTIHNFTRQIDVLLRDFLVI